MCVQAHLNRPCHILAGEIPLMVAYKLVVVSITASVCLSIWPPFILGDHPLSVLICTQAEFGFNEHHQNEVINYMRFARSKRVLRLRTIDSCFEELKDSR